MMYDIDIQAEVAVAASLLTLIETAVSTTLIHEEIEPPAGLSIVLSTDAHLHQLNQQFRQQDKPTDILSFPAPDMPGMDDYLGDIAISVAYAQRHADQEGHTLEEELQLLGVHGTLHLLGYDDMSPEEKKEMWAVQTAVLQKLNLSLNIPLDDA